MLLSRGARAAADALARDCRYVELSTRSGFQKTFHEEHRIRGGTGEDRVTTPDHFGLTIIGERINPGFKSTRALFDGEDMAGLQALAVKQAEAGAKYLNVNIGARALTDADFMARVIRAIQEVVAIAAVL